MPAPFVWYGRPAFARAGAMASATKTINHPLAVVLAWAEYAGRIAGTVEGRLIRRVGEESRLEAEAVAVTELSFRSASDRAIEKITGVELNPRGVGEDFQRTPGTSFRDAGSEAEAGGAAEVEAVIVATSQAELVVATSQAELAVLGVNILADAAGVAEVEGRAINAGTFARRDQRGVGWDEALRRNRQRVVKDVSLASEVEERVVSEVTQGWRIRRSSEVDAQFVGVVGQGVGDRDR